MKEMDRKHLEKLKHHARDTLTFLSNEMKQQRERAICRAFLRTIGISFKESEIIAPATEPADVLFRTALFQIRILLEGYKPGVYWKEREQTYLSTRPLDDPVSASIPLGFDCLVPKLEIAILRKAQDYKRRYKEGCSQTDALVYINLENRFLAADSRMPDLNRLKSQGWRSVSVLFPPYGVVLFTAATAPEFLRAIPPDPRREWRGAFDTLFEVKT